VVLPVPAVVFVNVLENRDAVIAEQEAKLRRPGIEVPSILHEPFILVDRHVAQEKQIVIRVGGDIKGDRVDDGESLIGDAGDRFADAPGNQREINAMSGRDLIRGGRGRGHGVIGPRGGGHSSLPVDPVEDPDQPQGRSHPLPPSHLP